MTREHAEVLRAIYDAWNRDDLEDGLRSLHPDIEWRSSGVFPGFEPVYRGHAGVTEYWRTLKEAWDYFTIEIEEMITAGAKVVTAVRFDAVGRESGVNVELRFAHVWEFKDRLAIRYGAYESLPEARAAAGLE